MQLTFKGASSNDCIDNMAMRSVPPALPTLTVNRSFMHAFLAAERPCCALGLVDVQHQPCGFLALRPDPAIPLEVSAIGVNFGHRLYGNRQFEVVHFSFEFYGYQTYHVLINPNNGISQRVLQAMLESGDYFFFALDEQSGGATAFRAGMEPDSLLNLKTDWERIQASTTTAQQYRQAISAFTQNADPPGVLLNWVCWEDSHYLDLSRDRLDLTPT